MAKNILITGAHGQLGNEIQNVLQPDGEFKLFSTDVETLDITDLQAIDKFITDNAIDIVVNCAAYTAVDKAEEDTELCHKLNSLAVENIANAAKNNNAKVIHISTDYVFDGTNYMPYIETDIPNPNSVYGSSKLKGEIKLMEILPSSIIIRTAWLYSPYGNNFVKTMLRLGQEKNSLSVVCDQIGTPTYAHDLAIAIASILKSNDWKNGVYHFSNEGATSWYDFTKAIHRIAGITTCEVQPVSSDKYPTKAKRPFYSVLNKEKIKSSFNITIPYWEESLDKCIKILEQQNR